VGSAPFFDTLRVRLGGGTDPALLHAAARARRVNLRRYEDGSVGVALDEKTDRLEISMLLAIFAGADRPAPAWSVDELLDAASAAELPSPFARSSGFLAHPVFHRYHGEHEMLRYIKRLESRDLSLAYSMIPLGSCTMKLNGSAEMAPVTWPEFCDVHPFAPADQSKGYRELFTQLEGWLAEITGFPGVSLQPNAGSQGEYTGLLVIRAFHAARGQAHRDACLIPVSAHGTNPASAALAGLKVVAVACDEHGHVELADLRAKCAEHQDRLAAMMITYPSTNGVFEEDVVDVCRLVHEHGGQVYMDGANMNAQVGLCRPGDIGADVCHLNLHKTFCIPHGGGGPGMGPICVAEHLRAFLPGHPAVPELGGAQAIGPVSAAPWGSPSILPIPWVYIALMGSEGLTKATQVAILNANYMAKRLEPHYPILFKGKAGRVAHEFVMDARQWKDATGIGVEDIAKRLMDYGFHAPTMSWPVAGTLMVEPTESESLAELDRLCDALIQIRQEIAAIAEGRADAQDNPLKNAPHSAAAVTAPEWKHPYSRADAAFPTAFVREHKFWPAVGRVDNAWGDRNLHCTCVSVEEAAS
jgi:glycine dehydrogenase